MENGRRSGKHPDVAARFVACVVTAALCGAGWGIGIEESPGYVPLSRLVPGAMPTETVIVTEGFYGGRIDGAFMLMDSPVMFVVGEETVVDLDLPKLTSREMVMVDGVTAYREESQIYYVRVRRMALAPDPRDKVLAALRENQMNPEALVQVGKWAEEKAAVYNDEALERLAAVAYMTALQAEEITLQPNDYEGYFRLANRADELLGMPSWKEDYVRKGINAFISRQPVKTAQVYYEAARKAESLLAGSILPEILIEQGFDVESGGRATRTAEDYHKLAARAKEMFGEGVHHRNLLSKAFDEEYAAVDTSDYTALYALGRRIKEIHPEYKNFRTIVSQAITAEKAAMDPRDAGAWQRLGNRILYFFDDKFQAGRAFITAAAIDPSNNEIRGRLREMGYVYYKGSWWRAEEFGRSDIFKKAQELEDLASAGQVAVGMSGDQVVRAYGMPQETFASGGGWGVTTQWVYKNEAKASYLSFLADTLVSKGEAVQ